MSINPIAYILALAVVVVIVTVPVTEVSKDFVPSTPSPTIPSASPTLQPTANPTSSAQQLIINNNFADSLGAEWTLTSNSPGGNPPVRNLYSSNTRDFTEAIKPIGASENYVLGGDGDTSTLPSTIEQTVNIPGGKLAYTFSASLGLTSTSSEGYTKLYFYDGDGFEIGNETRLTYIVGSTSTSYRENNFNGAYIKTQLRGKIDYSSGYKYVDDSNYPVYQRYGDSSVIFIKQTAFSGDRWSFYKGITWDINDLVNNYDIGADGVNYEDEIYSTSGNDVIDGLSYPPDSNLDFFATFDQIGFGINSDFIWDGSTFVDQFITSVYIGFLPVGFATAKTVSEFTNSGGLGYSALAFVELTVF